jgi:hypothetical protein
MEIVGEADIRFSLAWIGIAAIGEGGETEEREGRKKITQRRRGRSVSQRRERKKREGALRSEG